jgi:hypothetical protein
MGQPITVAEKPSSNPAILRFETNRPLSGMGHETYLAPPTELLDRPVDELARRLFAAGGIERVHINGSVITVSLAGGRTGAGLGDVVRNLFLHYGEQPSAGVNPPTDDRDRAPEMAADTADAPAARAAAEPAAAEPAAADVGAADHAVAVEDGAGDAPIEAAPVAAPVEGVPDDQLVAGTPAQGVGPEHEPTEGPIAEEPAAPVSDATRTAAGQAADRTDPEG